MTLGAVAQPYHPAALAHFARMASDNYELRNAINELIVGLIADGVWNKLDVICVVADNAGDSLLDLKGAYDAANVNGCAYVANNGFTSSDIGSSYINTNYTPGGSTQAQSASNSFWIYQRTLPVTESQCGAYASSNTGVLAVQLQRYAAGIQEGGATYYGGGPSGMVAETPGRSPGFCGGSRTATDSLETRVDDYANTTSGSSVTGLPALNLYIGARNSSSVTDLYTDNQIAGWGAGGGLTSTELANLRARIQAYMVARGAAV